MNEPRIYTRCPACHNDTLAIHEGHLLCTWHVCPDPTLIHRNGETPKQPGNATIHQFVSTLQKMNRQQLTSVLSYVFQQLDTP